MIKFFTPLTRAVMRGKKLPRARRACALRVKMRGENISRAAHNRNITARANSLEAFKSMKPKRTNAYMVKCIILKFKQN